MHTYLFKVQASFPLDTRPGVGVLRRVQCLILGRTRAGTPSSQARRSGR